MFAPRRFSVAVTRAAWPLLHVFVHLILCASHSSAAPVLTYDVFKNVFHTQTIADTPPFIDNGYACTMRLIATDTTTINKTTWTFTGSDSPIVLTGSNTNIISMYSSFEYSLAAFDARFSGGVYRCDATGPAYSGTGSLSVPAQHGWTPDLPYLTGTSLTDLNFMDTTRPLTLTVNTFTPGPGTNVAYTFLSIVGPTGEAYSTGFPNTDTTFTIPPSTLTPGTSYYLVIYFSSRIVNEAAGFGDAASISGWDRITYVPFTVPFVPPCGADFDRDGFLTFEDFDAFVAAFEAGSPSSDFDGDSFLTFNDFDAFVNAFEAGC